MANEGVATLYEIGPGKVLTGLAGRIVKELNAKAVNDVASLEAAAQ
ncbi:malonyl CoA-acyl carrier protein transacylase [Actinobacillus equuli]|nr:malonyl CoA-acyl carrier protein transacylase [Actinobacillus equuli]